MKIKKVLYNGKLLLAMLVIWKGPEQFDFMLSFIVGILIIIWAEVEWLTFYCSNQRKSSNN